MTSSGIDIISAGDRHFIRTASGCQTQSFSHEMSESDGQIVISIKIVMKKPIECAHKHKSASKRAKNNLRLEEYQRKRVFPSRERPFTRVNPVNPPSQVDSVIRPISRITSQVSPELRTTSPHSGISSSIVRDVLDRAPLSDSASSGSEPSSRAETVVSSPSQPPPASPAPQQTHSSTVDSEAKCRVHNSHSCPARTWVEAIEASGRSVEDFDEKFMSDLVQQEGKNSAFTFNGPNGATHRLTVQDHIAVCDGWVFYTQPKNNELSYWVIQLPGTTSPQPDPPEHFCQDHRLCLGMLALLFHGD